jgi:hypothetical protein
MAALIGGVAGFLPILLAPSHGCRLSSTLIECAMLAGMPLLAGLWTSRSPTRMRMWARAGLSFVAAAIIIFAYTSWLHTPSFPDWLLSSDAKAWRQQLELFRNQRIQETIINDASAPHPAPQAIGGETPQPQP